MMNGPERSSTAAIASERSGLYVIVRTSTFTCYELVRTTRVSHPTGPHSRSSSLVAQHERRNVSKPIVPLPSTHSAGLTNRHRPYVASCSQIALPRVLVLVSRWSFVTSSRHRWSRPTPSSRASRSNLASPKLRLPTKQFSHCIFRTKR